ncbi:MAG: hypothetical protein JWP75_1860, partial [Frondihabitans sp.]|nr:hypothetical protein [Frondihabitans sp.]
GLPSLILGVGITAPPVRDLFEAVAVAFLVAAGCIVVTTTRSMAVQFGEHRSSRFLFLCVGLAQVLDLALRLGAGRPREGGEPFPSVVPGLVPALLASALAVAILRTPSAARGLRVTSVVLAAGKVAGTLLAYGLGTLATATIAAVLPVVDGLSALTASSGVAMGLVLAWPWIQPRLVRALAFILRIQRAHRDSTP